MWITLQEEAAHNLGHSHKIAEVYRKRRGFMVVYRHGFLHSQSALFCTSFVTPTFFFSQYISSNTVQPLSFSIRSPTAVFWILPVLTAYFLLLLLVAHFQIFPWPSTVRLSFFRVAATEHDVIFSPRTLKYE